MRKLATNSNYWSLDEDVHSATSGDGQHDQNAVNGPDISAQQVKLSCRAQKD